MPELYDHKAAIAGRVHRRRVERRVYPARTKVWCTADYVRAYFALNTAQSGRFYKSAGVHAYAPGEQAHAEWFQTMSRTLQHPVDDVVVETTD
jgi:hypothetical protein